MANHAFMKELYKLARNVGKLTCGQARIDLSCEQERSFYLFITPDDGYYKGATCKFKVTVPESFPTEAPLVRCLNSIYHPNIDIDPYESEVCVNLLAEDWQPGVGLDGCVMAVLYLFHHPNLEDALNQLFDDVPMDELQFIENVRVSLRGGELDGFRFDRLINDNEEDFSVNEQDNDNIRICQETNVKNKEVGMFGNRNDSKYIILDDDSSYIEQVDYFGIENEGNSNNNDDKMASDIINLSDDANTEQHPTALEDNADPISRNNTQDIDTTKTKIVKERFWYFRLVILSSFTLSMVRFYPQIWHKVLTICQRFYNR